MSPEQVAPLSGAAAGLPEPQRRRVRRLFAVVALLLVAQGAVITLVEEPYPTLRLPDFRGSPDLGGYVQRDEPVLSITFADGGLTVAAARLFAGADAPEALVAVVFPESPAPAKTGGAIGRVVRRYADAFGVFEGSRSAAPQTATWLRGRIAELYPGRTARQFAVTWTRARYTLSGQRTALQTLNTVTVRLDR